MKNFGKFCFAIILSVLSVLLGGFVFLKLYEWFIVTAFHTPKICIIQAIGLRIIIAYLKPQTAKDEEKATMQKFKKEILLEVLKSIMVLVIGYLIFLCI